MTSTLRRLTDGPSIYESISDHLTADGRLDNPWLRLPDEPSPDAEELHWAPGAADGVLAESDSDAAEAKAHTAAELLLETARNPSDDALSNLYALLRDECTPTFVQALADDVDACDADSESVHELGRWLATTATHRGPVKAGLALIAVTGIGDDGDLVRVLGAHDEFTLYAAAAIENGSPSPERDLFQLAQSVSGWGRIHTVERLRDTADPEIREWVLRDGFRNAVMDEYLAYIAATTGDLAGALRRPTVDRGLLSSAGEIIDALIDGGPAEDIGDIDDGPDVIAAYLDLLADRAETLIDLRTAKAISRLVRGGDESHACADHGWSESDAVRVADKARGILDMPHWPRIIGAGLQSADRRTFWLAINVAPDFDIDTFDLLFDRLQRDPVDGPWYHAWQRADAVRAETLVDLARSTFPREAIDTGDPDTIGFGPKFRLHREFGWTLQELRAYPGLGADLVVSGLLSPTGPNRNMALRVPEAWPVDAWPTEARERLQEISASDSHESTRTMAEEVLARVDA